MTTRRGFLGAMLAAAAAPAFVRAGSLMPIYVPERRLLTLWGDGIHDDARAMQTIIDGGMVLWNGKPIGGHVLPVGDFLIRDSLMVTKRGQELNMHLSRVMWGGNGDDKPMLRLNEPAIWNVTSNRFLDAGYAAISHGAT